MTAYETSQFDLDREKIAIERERLQLEQQKLRDERRRTLLTAGSIFVPLLIAALTFFYHIVALHQQVELAHQQAELARELQVAEAQATFALKAAEIVMDTQTPSAAKNRARALADLFPDRLPLDFPITFQISDADVYGGSPPLEARIELFRALVEYPDRALEIHGLWSDAFPPEGWWLYIPSGEPDIH